LLKEMDDASTPEVVRRWVAAPPAWLQVQEPGHIEDIPRLGHGKRGAGVSYLTLALLKVTTPFMTYIANLWTLALVSVRRVELAPLFELVDVRGGVFYDGLRTAPGAEKARKAATRSCDVSIRKRRSSPGKAPS